MFEQPSAVATASVLTAALVGLHVLRTLSRGSSAVYAKPKSTLPILGNTLDMVGWNRDRMLEWFAEQCEELQRPWRLSLGVGGATIVVISMPELFEDVLKTQAATFGRYSEANILRDLFGQGILSTDGDAWYFHRKTASNLFSHQMMRDVMFEAIRDKCERLVTTLHAYEARAEPASLKSVITRFTSDVFGKIGFGVDLNCLENGLNGVEGNEFIGAFSDAVAYLWVRYNLPEWLWGAMRSLNVGYERKLKQRLGVINDFVFRVINASMERKRAADAAGERAQRPKDLISLFLTSNMAGDEPPAAKFFGSEMHLIRDTVVNFIFAGKDTTSNTIGFFVVMMNRYPDVLAKIRAELRAKVPAFASGQASVPPIDDLPRLTYLEAAIRENLRLNPILPLAAREAAADTVLVDGTPIPKGTRIAIAIYTVNRSKALWGEDADEFKPERWIDPETGNIIAVSPFKYMTFMGGPRQCIGMKFALMEMKCALAVLLSRFDLKTVEDPWSLTYEIAMTMSVKGAVMTRISSVSGMTASSPVACGAAREPHTA